MVWSKTQAGRQEIKARSQVAGRAPRTLLLLVDGVRGDAELLASVAGTTPDDFAALAALGLIAPALPAGTRALPAATAAATTAPADSVWQATLSGPASAAEAASAGTSTGSFTDTPGRYTDLSRALTEMIASQLGFRGFVLTMAVEKAATFHELRAVAERVITAIGDRKGPAQARAAHRALFGE